MADVIRGIDVSHWQGTINWSAVARDGIEFAWIKATQGQALTDKRFRENREGAAAVGIRWGAHQYFK